MNKNSGNIDRGLRIFAGLALLSQAFWGLQTPWGYIGIILLATGAIGYCPLYTFVGVSTCQRKDSL